MGGKMADNKKHYLKDYKKPDYLVDHVDLEFDLDETQTVVTSSLTVRADYDDDGKVKPMFLDGEELKLLSVSIDGKKLKKDEYELTDEGMMIKNPPKEFKLDIQTEINPKDNTALMGLYLSGGIYTTQNEANGFRRITYFPDRTDMMSTYSTTIRAVDELPVLLSNGTPVDKGVLEDGRHYAKWDDPWPKHPNLYAMVAGDLDAYKDKFVTKSGKVIPLAIYVEKGKSNQCEFAMESLKKSMKWDEERWGREYDLGEFNIVAVPTFNMGAMENKGLNIFNDKMILAAPKTATDAEFVNVERVVGHEYFHNWTGNRVGIRDFFNLTAKEGLTSFRDQEFSSDLRDREVKRIADVTTLRAAQFPEDAGPMAHSVRPSEYESINNFYTATVYNKGAEVIRMMEKMVGKEGFRKGMDLFFDRHDGEPITTEQYVKCIEDANKIDLTKFKESWYAQAGTPRVEAKGVYDKETQTYKLTLKQSTPATPGQAVKKPFMMPIEVGLLDSKGDDMALKLEGEKGKGETSKTLVIDKAEQTFTFTNIKEEPVLSGNRGFSAPVYFEAGYSKDDYKHLMSHDSDSFNRWEAGQQYGTQVLLSMVKDIQAGKSPKIDSEFVEAIGSYLKDDSLSPSYKAKAITLPSEKIMAEHMDEIAPTAIHKARETLTKAIALKHKGELLNK
jgi:aminopeptidase N